MQASTFRAHVYYENIVWYSCIHKKDISGEIEEIKFKSNSSKLLSCSIHVIPCEVNEMPIRLYINIILLMAN